MLAEREIGVRFPSQNGLRVGISCPPSISAVISQYNFSGITETIRELSQAYTERMDCVKLFLLYYDLMKMSDTEMI